MKRKIVGTFISAVVMIVLMFSAACGYSASDVSDTVDLDTFRRVSYDASAEYETALGKYNNGCESAKVIRDDHSIEDKQIALVIQGSDENILIEKAIELLEDHNTKASFTVTAMAAAEDDNTLKLIASKGHEIVDNGLNGNDEISIMSDEEIIYNLSSSRKVFSTLLDVAPDKLMLNDVYYTDNICMAAYACGYDKLVAPGPGNYLNEKSFKDKEKAREYVSRLTPGTIIVFKLDGIIDSLEIEPKNDYQTPAIDKQPTTDAQAQKTDELQAIKVLSWLLEALDEDNCKITGLDSFKAMSDEEYIASLLKENQIGEADVIEQIDTMESVVGLAFNGVPNDAAVTSQLIDLLTENKANATFFVSAAEVDEYSETIHRLLDAGFCFATKGTQGEDLIGKSVYEDYEDLHLGIRKIQKELSVRARFYMPAGKVDNNMSMAVCANGLSIVLPRYEIMAQKGKLNCFKISDDFSTDMIESFLKKAKNENLEVVDVYSLAKTADSVPKIDDETIRSLREANEGKLAYKKDYVYTTEKAMSLTFYGITNKTVLNDVLKILDMRGYKGTFFVTFDELVNYHDEIERILEEGHEIGIAYVDKNAETESQFDDVLTYILSVQKYAEWKYDTELNLVFQPYGEVQDETKEAVSAAGCVLVGHEYVLVHSEDVDAQDINSFYSKLTAKVIPHRGSIAFFNMNFYNADKDLPDDVESTLLGDLLKRFISTKIISLTYTDVYGQRQYSTSYTVKTVSALSHSGYVYYPISSSSTKVYNTKNVMGNMVGETDQNDYMESRYVGNPAVSYIPGFSESEMKKFDVSGKVSADKVLFLTFDDWGYEKNINELLYVLDKYGVKANFFVRTNNVSNNPNLLRAIAVSGHMIGSHTDTHYVAWKEYSDVQGNYVFDSLNESEAAEFRKDIVKSYGTLNRYCGDVYVDGKPALSTIFRPPTLGVSREGMYQIFDVGYSYIVSGDFSTIDYDIDPLEALVNELRNGKSTWYGKAEVGSGSVLIMHMSPDAEYTSGALDIMIPEWQAQGYTFARLDDYLK